MSTPPFAHLHCHSHYSLLDGAGTIRGLLERAKEPGDDRPGPDRPRQPARGGEVLPDGQGTGHQSDPRASRPTSPPAAGSTRRPPARRRPAIT